MKLPPFDHFSNCPKCGGAGGEVKSSMMLQLSLFWPFVWLGDAMKRTCRYCRAVWWEAPLDKVKP